jgi:sugar lactone lactonase YvrE
MAACGWGTVDSSGADRAGLFRVDEAGQVTQTLSGRALSNGMDWSPDGRRCHHADSLPRRVEVRELDDEGFPMGVEVFATFSRMPDGLTVDEEGGVWVALWDGAGVQRSTHDGRHDRTLPVTRGWITSCAFGGDDLRALYITSAKVDLDAETQRRCGTPDRALRRSRGWAARDTPHSGRPRPDDGAMHTPGRWHSIG